MRSPTDSPDPDLPLSAPIRPEKPAPAPTPTDSKGIYRRPDGKLETQIPEPPIWHPAPVVHVDEQCED